MTNSKAAKATYTVISYTVIDHPELRGAGFVSSPRAGTTVVYRAENLTKAQADSLVAELELGRDDFVSECVYSIRVHRHGKFSKLVRDITRNTERWDACCSAVKATDWAA